MCVIQEIKSDGPTSIFVCVYTHTCTHEHRVHTHKKNIHIPMLARIHTYIFCLRKYIHTLTRTHISHTDTFSFSCVCTYTHTNTVSFSLFMQVVVPPFLLTLSLSQEVFDSFPYWERSPFPVHFSRVINIMSFYKGGATYLARYSWGQGTTGPTLGR